MPGLQMCSSLGLCGLQFLLKTGNEICKGPSLVPGTQPCSFTEQPQDTPRMVSVIPVLRRENSQRLARNPGSRTVLAPKPGFKASSGQVWTIASSLSPRQPGTQLWGWGGVGERGRAWAGRSGAVGTLPTLPWMPGRSSPRVESHHPPQNC